MRAAARFSLLFTVVIATACHSTSPASSASPASAASPAPSAMAGPAPAVAEPSPSMPARAGAAPAPATAGPMLSEPTADQLGTVPAGLGLKVGAKAPDATLPDIAGRPQRLGALYREAPTFVVFYRGGWCPFCNLQLHGLSAATPDFARQGVRLVAISVDQPGEEAKTQAKNGVPFPMLSDSKLVVHRAFNVVHVPPDEEAKALAHYGVDLEAYSGENHHSFAVPSIFLIDRAGVVRWVHIDQDYKTRPSPAQLLAVAARLVPAAR